MTRAGIDYIRGIYLTAIERKKRAEGIENEFSRGLMLGYHGSTIDLCHAIALFEGFSLVDTGEGETK